VSKHPDIPVNPDWVTSKIVAERLGVTPQYAYRMVVGGKFKSVTLLEGTSIPVVSKEELNEILNIRAARA
jgi:predicted site-specific integrase-resolvase